MLYFRELQDRYQYKRYIFMVYFGKTYLFFGSKAFSRYFFANWKSPEAIISTAYGKQSLPSSSPDRTFVPSSYHSSKAIKEKYEPFRGKTRLLTRMRTTLANMYSTQTGLIPRLMLNFWGGGNFFVVGPEWPWRRTKFSPSADFTPPTSFAHHQVNQVLMMPQ